MIKKEKLKWPVIAIMSATALTVGCSSGGSGSSDTSEFSGVAFDGYLVGATICADVNRNKACDSGEPTTTTEKGGVWSLDLTSEQAGVPIVLQANENTIDEDTGDGVDLNLTYSAPAGSTVVNAITTIIQNKVEEALATDTSAASKTNEQLVAEANAAVLLDLGLTEDIDFVSTDFVGLKTDEDETEANQELFAKLHIINQVVTQQIVTVVPQAESLGGSDNAAAAFNASIGNIDLGEVNTVVETAITGTAPQDLVSFAAATVQAPTVPVPSLQDILDQAELDEIVNEGEAPVEPPVVTGGTGGTGGGG